MDNLDKNKQFINSLFCGYRRLEIHHKCVPKPMLAWACTVPQRVNSCNIQLLSLKLVLPLSFARLEFKFAKDNLYLNCLYNIAIKMLNSVV